MWTILTDREHSSLLQQEVADALPNYLLKPHLTPPTLHFSCWRKNMSTHPANRYTQFITPLGGIIALSCFSLPWHTEINFSSTRLGFQYLLVPRATFIAIVFMASVMIVGVSLYMVIRRTLWKSAPILRQGTNSH